MKSSISTFLESSLLHSVQICENLWLKKYIYVPIAAGVALIAMVALIVVMRVRRNKRQKSLY